MIEKFLEQFTKTSKNIKLTQAEKDHIRNKLLQFSVRNAGSDRHTSRQYSFFQNFMFKFKTSYLVLPLVVVFGAGITSASETALPGDFLYPVKIHVVEPVRSSLAFSSEAKAQVQVEFAQRRLVEAEKLAVNGRLSADVRTRISNDFKRHTKAFEKEMKRLKDVDAADVAAEFSTALKVHEEVLNVLDGRVNAVASYQKSIHDLRSAVDAKIEARPENQMQNAAEGRIKVAENKIREVRRFISNADVDAEIKVRAEAQLKNAESLYAQGKARFEAKSYTEAFQLLKRAQDIAQEAKIMVATHGRLAPEVRIRIREETRRNPDGVREKSEIRLEEKVQNNGEIRERREEQEFIREQKEVHGSGDVKIDVRTDAKASSDVRINTNLLKEKSSD